MLNLWANETCVGILNYSKYLCASKYLTRRNRCFGSLEKARRWRRLLFFLFWAYSSVTIVLSYFFTILQKCYIKNYTFTKVIMYVFKVGSHLVWLGFILCCLFCSWGCLIGEESVEGKKDEIRSGAFWWHLVNSRRMHMKSGLHPSYSRKGVKV